MKITIVGAGLVGTHLAKYLADEHMDIFVIDTDSRKLSMLDSEYNLMTIVGDGTVFSTLRQAEVETCDLFIAVTEVAERNIVSCGIAKSMGAKIDRLLYMLKNFLYVVRKYVRPRLMKSVSINGQNVEQEQRDEIVAFIFIYTLLIIIGGMVLIAQDFPIVDAFFSSFSCVSNNGLGAGLTGSTGSFDFLPPFGKWVMSFLMLAGRLEIITFFAVFVPAFWKK